jgi:hypothetical protein
VQELTKMINAKNESNTASNAQPGGTLVVVKAPVLAPADQKQEAKKAKTATKSHAVLHLCVPERVLCLSLWVFICPSRWLQQLMYPVWLHDVVVGVFLFAGEALHAEACD